MNLINNIICIQTIKVGDIEDFTENKEYYGSLYLEDLYLCDNSGVLRRYDEQEWKRYFKFIN